MKSLRIYSCTLGAILLASSAWAQVGNISPYFRPTINPRPTVSPFVRLRDGGGAITYFGQIRPQMQNTRDIQQIQQNLLGIEQQGTGYGLPQDQIILPITGHPVRFFDNSYFFSRVGAGAVSPLRGAGGGGNYNQPIAPLGATGIIRQ